VALREETPKFRADAENKFKIQVEVRVYTRGELGYCSARSV
jgi:hypothetical protein